MKKALLCFLSVILLTFVSSNTEAQTNVSGGIYTNTTWTLANSPYIVVDTIVVFPGVTLTIEPGVVVKFANNIEIEIRQAILTAVGTATDSITFTSNAVSPSAGIYPGIYLNGGTYTSRFNYCNFRFANIGISVNVSDSVIVNNSDFGNNVTGLQFVGTGTGQVAKIDSSIFQNSTYGLVLESLHHATISYCNFSYDSIAGFVLADGSETFIAMTDYCNFSNNGIGLSMDMYLTTINHCNFLNNSYGLKGVGFQTCCATWNLMVRSSTFNFNQTGINNLGHISIDSCTIIHSQSGYTSSGGGILNSIVDSNSIIGISGGGDSIVNCEIKYNGTGIIMTAYSKIYASSIENNTLKNIRVNNGGLITGSTIRYSNIGVEDTLGSFGIGVTLTNNIIDNNNIGLRLYSSNSTINCNRICNNNMYALQYAAVNNTVASNNYWCTADSVLLETMIYDGYDNINYGLVSFMPMDTTNCYFPTGISADEILPASFSIFPNPANDKFTISKLQPAIKAIEIYNLVGEKIYSAAQVNSEQVTVNCELFPKGIYFVQVSNEKEKMTEKLVVE